MAKRWWQIWILSINKTTTYLELDIGTNNNVHLFRLFSIPARTSLISTSRPAESMLVIWDEQGYERRKRWIRVSKVSTGKLSNICFYEQLPEVTCAHNAMNLAMLFSFVQPTVVTTISHLQPPVSEGSCENMNTFTSVKQGKVFNSTSHHTMSPILSLLLKTVNKC